MPYVGGLWYNDADEIIALLVGSNPPGWLFNAPIGLMFADSSDKTKNFTFDLSGITTATKRVLTIQDSDGTIPLLEAVEQTWTGRHIISPAGGDFPSLVVNISPDRSYGSYPVLQVFDAFTVDTDYYTNFTSFRFWPSGIGTDPHIDFTSSLSATNRTVNFGDVSGTVILHNAIQTISNKTIQTSLTFSSGANIILNTTTGTKIGAATNQKLGFWNATPVIQPTNAIAAAAFVANTSGIVDDSATWGGYTAGQIVAALKQIGILA